jgi:hypothetical protein
MGLLYVEGSSFIFILNHPVNERLCINTKWLLFNVREMYKIYIWKSGVYGDVEIAATMKFIMCIIVYFASDLCLNLLLDWFTLQS